MDQQVAYSHGQAHQYEQDPSNVGSPVEVEDHEKKSVLKKVKAKAKKIKDTLKLHGHGHNHDQQQEGHVPDDHDLDEEDDEEEVVDPEIHGSSGNGAAANKSAVAGQNLEVPGTFIGRSRAMDENSSKNSLAKVTDYPTETASFVGREEGKDQLDQLKVDVGKTGQIKEVPSAPVNTPATLGIFEQEERNEPARSLVREQEANSGQREIQLEGLQEDPRVPRGGHVDSSNYQTKFTDATGTGGEEAGIGSIVRSLDKMSVHESKPGGEQNISAEPRGFSSVIPTGSRDQFSPELAAPKQIRTDQNNAEPIQQGAGAEVQELPPDEVSQKPSNQSSYTDKISSATSAIADKAVSAKNVVASKLGYGQGQHVTHEGQGQHETHEGRESAKGASTIEYGKKIAATVTEKLTPVYQKVTETGSTVISKVPGIGKGTGNASEKSGEGKDKGVSVKEYFAEKLRPGDEDRALSEVIAETLHKRKDEGENGKPMGRVTESEEVKRRLGGLDESPILKAGEDESDERVPGKGVVDKLKGAVGSWFGKGEVTNPPSEQSLGCTTGTEGFESSTVGAETGEGRLQESGN